MDRLGIGVVGTGAHAVRSHIEALEEIAEARVVALCDVDRERARSVGLGSAACYADYGMLLRDPEVEAVVICTPDRFHTEQLELAIEAGKHVLVEKPVADQESGCAGCAMHWRRPASVAWWCRAATRAGSTRRLSGRATNWLA